MAADNKHICVIDMGSAHVTAVIAEIHAVDKIEVLGFGHTQNRGMQRGRILDMDKVVACLKQAISYAEDMADCRVHTAWLCIANPDMKSDNCHGRVSVADVEVKTTDMARALARAKQEILRDDYYLTNHFLQGVSINNDESMTMSSISMMADHIEAFYHLMMVPIQTMQNMQQAMHLANVQIEKTLLNNIASSSYSLLPEEREQGVCLVDIGSDTTSIAVYGDNKLIFSQTLPVGGYDVTRDIATELRISMVDADRIKLVHGKVNLEDIDFAKIIEVPASEGMAAVMVNARELGEIMAARYEEILLKVMMKIDEKGLLAVLKRGMVYCGGGTEVQNFARFASRVTGMSAQKANFPQVLTVADSKRKRLDTYYYQTACGALLYSQSEQFFLDSQSEIKSTDETVFEKILKKPYERFIRFLSDVF